MYQSVSEMLAETDRSGRPLWEVILEDDCAERGVKRENSLKEMRRIWEAMKQADAGYDGKIRSASGLVGTDGQKYAEARSRRESLCGPLMGSVIEKALTAARPKLVYKVNRNPLLLLLNALPRRLQLWIIKRILT